MHFKFFKIIEQQLLKHIAGILVVVLCVVSLLPAVAYANTDTLIVTHETIVDIPVRPGVTTDISLTSYRTGAGACKKIAVAVPGYAHTAATWKPFAQAYLAGSSVCAVVAIDLPGHGLSGLPQGISFGELVLDDYATIVAGVLQTYTQGKVQSKELIGHSQGALVIQMLQQRLLNQATSLRNAYKVKQVLLLAPAQPAGQSWYFVDSGNATALLSTFLSTDTTYGAFVGLPGFLFPTLFFTNLLGSIASDAPDSTVFSVNGYVGIEPLYGSLQLSGGAPFVRPAIASGIFNKKHKTKLTVVGYENDTVVLQQEAAALYTYLSGDTKQKRYTVVPGFNAVHDAYLSQPATTIEALQHIQ